MFGYPACQSRLCRRYGFCLTAQPIESKRGGDLSPLNQPSNIEGSGLGAEMDLGRRNEDDPLDEPHDAEASGSGEHHPSPIPEEVGSAPVVSVRDLGSAIQADIDEHDKTHLPYMSWCQVCVMAKGKEDARFKNKTMDKGRPVVAYDFKSFGQELKEDGKTTTLVS